MSSGNSNRFACEGCKRSYSWKAELAGKRVKCKCGQVMTVPQEPPKPDVDEDALYDLADVEEKAAKTQQATVVAAPIAVAASAGSRGGTKPVKKSAVAGVPLAYRNAQTAREQAISSSSVHTDMKRDVYVPVALFVGGMLLYVSYYLIRYQLGGTGVAITFLGIGLMTALKAGLLIGFALMVSGPLGVSFGHPGTAVLKLAAVAVSCDGVTTWVDAGVAKMAGLSTGGGIFGWGAISFPIALGMYWLLLIYLFSMDSEDSWQVVILLAIFDRVVKLLLAMLILKAIFSWGGMAGAASAIPSFGGGPPPTANPLAVKVTELQETHGLEEARAFIADGHQAVLKDSVEGWYTAGCPNVWFTVSRDFNGKREPYGVIVEMPKDKDKRARVYEILKAYYDKVRIQYKPQDMQDKGDQYIEVEML